MAERSRMVLRAAFREAATLGGMFCVRLFGIPAGAAGSCAVMKLGIARAKVRKATRAKVSLFSTAANLRAKLVKVDALTRELKRVSLM